MVQGLLFLGCLLSSLSSSLIYAKSKLGPFLTASLITSKDKNLPVWFSRCNIQVQVQVQPQTTLRAAPHALHFHMQKISQKHPLWVPSFYTNQ